MQRDTNNDRSNEQEMKRTKKVETPTQCKNVRKKPRENKKPKPTTTESKPLSSKSYHHNFLLFRLWWFIDFGGRHIRRWFVRSSIRSSR